VIDVVVKIGGGLLRYPDALDAVLGVIAEAGKQTRLLLVPGGGPFADVVRHVERQTQLSDDAAHWMAVLAMDQYAQLIADRMQNSMIVSSPSEMAIAAEARRLPVLAPSQWLREADPLPHSWEVTSDSIAAWIAGALSASALVLIKPPGTEGLPESVLLDRYFARALPVGVKLLTVDGGRLELLRTAFASARTHARET